MSGTTGTPRTQSFLLNSEFQDGQLPNSISPQDLRDFIVTVVPTGQVLTSGSSITMTTTYLGVNKTSGSPTTVTLPSFIPPFTQAATVKDMKGDASVNNITIVPPSGLIDGQSSFVISTNFGAPSFMPDGVNWSLV